MSGQSTVIRVERNAHGFVAVEPEAALEGALVDRIIPMMQSMCIAEPGTVLVKGRPMPSEEIYWDEASGVGYAVISPLRIEARVTTPAFESELSDVGRHIWRAVWQSESLTEDSAISVAADFLEPGLRCFERAGERRLPWYEFRSIGRAVLIGEPGAGKTTSLQRLALDVLENRSGGRNGIPLFVRLRGFHEKVLDLPALVEKAGLRAESELTNHLIHSSMMTLLLDGLDEVTHERQATMVDEILALSDQLPQLQIVVTCRQASYVDKPLPGFKTVAIAPFDDNQLAQWSNRYFRRRGAEHIWHDFLDSVQAQEAVRDLCRNPLLLNLTARLYESSAVLPSSRTDLYGRCLRAMTFEWDAARGVRRFNRGELWHNDVQHALREAALRALEDWTQPIDESEAAAGAKVDLLTIARSSGLLARDEDGYRFVHSSFVEYLAAESLTRASIPVREALRDRLAEAQWQSVWLITCGLLTDASELCEDVLDHPDLAIQVKLRLLSSAVAQGTALSEDVERKVAEFISSALLEEVQEIEGRSLSAEEAKSRRPDIRPLAPADFEGWQEVALACRTPAQDRQTVEDVVLALHQAVSSGFGTTLIRVLEGWEDARARILAGALRAVRMLPRPKGHADTVDVWVQGTSPHRGVAPDVPADTKAAEEPVGE